MAKSIMIQGTMSNAGKSLIAAGLCRIFKQDGYRVAPFKSQNMALNSYITEEGLEMGRAQVMQAEAAGVRPMVEMNPILLKPTNDTGSQVIVNGEVLGNMKAKDYFSYKKELIPEIKKAYAKLEQWADIIVIEGAGSPAEINLKENDIVNMGLAELVDAPVLIVGDIDRGGVFAQLLGTLLLLEEQEKERVKGFIINKFRGDVSILEPGIRMLEEKGGIPVTGVVPYMQLTLEDEDSLTTRFANHKEALIDIAVIRFPRISNFTDFMVFEQYEGVSLRYVTTPEELHQPDLIILPGSKNTMGDLKWLRQNGLEAAIKKKAETTPIFGICGGYQMLGETLSDPHNIEEGGTLRGMELLPIETELTEQKTRTQVQGSIGELTGIFSVLSQTNISGYEIHMGKSKKTKPAPDFCTISNKSNPISSISSHLKSAADKMSEDGNSEPALDRIQPPGRSPATPDGTFCNNVYGTYVHGIFDEGDIAYKIVKSLAAKKGISLENLTSLDYQTFKEKEYDKLAATLRQYLDMKAIYKLLDIT